MSGGGKKISVKPWKNPGVQSSDFGGSSLRFDSTLESVPSPLRKPTAAHLADTKRKVHQGRIDDINAKARKFKWGNHWRPTNIHTRFVGHVQPGDQTNLESLPPTYTGVVSKHIKESKKQTQKDKLSDIVNAKQDLIKSFKVKAWVPNGYAANNYVFEPTRKRFTVGDDNIHGKY